MSTSSGFNKAIGKFFSPQSSTSASHASRSGARGQSTKTAASPFSSLSRGNPASRTFGGTSASSRSSSFQSFFASAAAPASGKKRHSVSSSSSSSAHSMATSRAKSRLSFSCVYVASPMDVSKSRRSMRLPSPMDLSRPLLASCTAPSKLSESAVASASSEVVGSLVVDERGSVGWRAGARRNATAGASSSAARMIMLPAADLD
mmetsp:Transcript_4984/g.16655  ORF Transcript_4984/g.16655 Transcript_4984/m.16655 type:complete len:204 (-) Transcript_4984:79-690(-)